MPRSYSIPFGTIAWVTLMVLCALAGCWRGTRVPAKGGPIRLDDFIDRAELSQVTCEVFKYLGFHARLKPGHTEAAIQLLADLMAAQDVEDLDLVAPRHAPAHNASCVYTVGGKEKFALSFLNIPPWEVIVSVADNTTGKVTTMRRYKANEQVSRQVERFFTSISHMNEWNTVDEPEKQ